MGQSQRQRNPQVQSFVRPRSSRRDFLKGLGLAATGAVLSACNVQLPAQVQEKATERPCSPAAPPDAGPPPKLTDTPLPSATFTSEPTVLPAPTPSLTSSPTATKEPTLTSTNTPTPTDTATATATPSPKPTNTLEPTPIPEFPLDLPLHYLVDINTIPSELFGREPGSILVGDYYFNNSGEIGPNTVLERWGSYEGFEGPVVHARVDGPPPSDGMQRAFVGVERAWPQPEGPWAWEASYKLLAAPNLVDSGWHRDPIASLQSVLMHYAGDDTDPSLRFKAAGGIRPWSEGNKYYASLYTVDTERNTSNSVPGSKVAFDVGVKQGLRLELYYDPENANKATIRAFLIRFISDQKTYIFIGKSPLAPNIPLIRGEIGWLGAYVGYPVAGYEMVTGEARIFRQG